eukprot:CAMPEP_0184872532 /NCGR_PEP_ID=MMETSP0580-20130426/41343_1 /TAXON_ID=1118495 /ORGANISM="Dactyliosolen fragilissimus" /LENGTH=807 /DNA_ID=CAMNT_0027375347 /DNA_START=175 /DNA_END=2598 /DNA_ORIENTATION=+
MTEFRPSSQLRLPNAPIVNSIHAYNNSTSSNTNSNNNTGKFSLPTEEKWWTKQFFSKKYTSTSSTKVSFTTPSGNASSIDHLSFSPVGGDGSDGNGVPSPLTVCAGPRACVYGGTGSSSLSRALMRKKKNQKKSSLLRTHHDEEEEEEETRSESVVVQPDRTLVTQGRLTYCVAHRKEDGRLIALGCLGQVRVCDSWSRSTVRTFVCDNDNHAGSGAGAGEFAVRTVGWLPSTFIGSDSSEEEEKEEARTTSSTSASSSKRMKMLGKKIWSAGDDALLRIWDLAGNNHYYPNNDIVHGEKSDKVVGDTGNAIHSDNIAPIATLRGHGDSIRACVSIAIPNNNDENDGSVVVGGGGSSSAKKKNNKTKKEDRILLATGSYDHTIRIWDVPQYLQNNAHNIIDDGCLSIMNHGAPVQCLIIIQPPQQHQQQQHNHPSSSSSSSQQTTTTPILASAGGTYIKLWNPLTGNCLATISTMHSKTITGMCLTTILKNQYKKDVRQEDNPNPILPIPSSTTSVITQHRRLLTVGLDGLLRIHSADFVFPLTQTTATITSSSSSSFVPTLPYLHGMKITPHHPITSMAISTNNLRIAFGTSVGIVTVFQRAKFVMQHTKQQREQQQQQLSGTGTGAKRSLTSGSNSEPRHGTFSYFFRGANFEPHIDDRVVLVQKRRKLQEYDKLLRQFRYGDALDEALTKDPRAVAMVLEELGRRNGLRIALSDRDEERLEPILSFTTHFLARPQFTRLLVGVANILIDIYGCVHGQSDHIDQLFEKLKKEIQLELRALKHLSKLMGAMDAVMYTAEVQEQEQK